MMNPQQDETGVAEMYRQVSNQQKMIRDEQDQLRAQKKVDKLLPKVINNIEKAAQKGRHSISFPSSDSWCLCDCFRHEPSLDFATKEVLRQRLVLLGFNCREYSFQRKLTISWF